MTYDVSDLSDAQIWRFAPDLGRGFELRRAFQTDIFTSRNGTEQRRATRDRPRVSCRFDCPIWSDDDFKLARIQLRGSQNAPTAIPDYTRRATLASASSAASDQLDLGTVPDWIVEGSWLILCNAGDYELVQVDSIYLDVITLTAPLANGFSTGATVRRALVGLLNGALRSTMTRHGAQTITVQLDVYPSLIPQEPEAGTVETLDGYDIFDENIDFSARPGMTYQFPVEQIDFGIGRTAQFRPIEFAREITETTHTGLAFADVDRIERFFMRTKGSRGAFWRSTREHDFTISSLASGGDHIVIADDNAISDQLGAIDYSEEPLAVALCLDDGTKVYRRVQNIFANGTQSRIDVAGNISASVSEIVRGSFMRLVRFANDELSIEYGGSNNSSTRLRFQGVRR